MRLEDVAHTYEVPTRNPVEMFGLNFYAYFNKQGNYVGHQSSFDGLNVRIRAGRLFIENSLHKFHKGNNYTDFTHSEIVNAIKRIEDQFNISSEDLKFKKIEVAINYPKTIQLHKQFGLYVMNEFENMRKDKKTYGKKFFGSDYNVKSYDKSLETKLRGSLDAMGNKTIIPLDINRFEVQYKRMRPLEPILTNLSDLKNRDTLEKLGLMIMKCFDKIKFSKKYNYSILTPRERELVFAGYNSQFWEEEKINMNTRKKKRILFNKCIKKLDSELSNDPKIEIQNLLLEKINYLVSN